MALALCILSGLLPAQTPSVEYVYLGGRVVATEAPETVSTPNTPTGTTSGSPGIAYTYSVSGSVSNAGDSVQYKLIYSDGTDSGWLAAGTTSANKTWSVAGNHSVTAQARCATHTSVVSSVSAALQVTIAAAETVSTPSTPSKSGGVYEGGPNVSYTFTAGGAASSLGHEVQYKLLWGDGAESGWFDAGSSASHGWSTTGQFSVTAQARCKTHTSIVSTVSSARQMTIETVSTPSRPTISGGVYEGTVNTSYTFTASGATSSQGHTLQYKIFWGDGADSGWFAAGSSVSHSWSTSGQYSVTAQARCQTHTSIVSTTSSARQMTINTPTEVISTPDPPDGETTPLVGVTTYNYSTTGSESNLPGHSVRYRIDWDDGTMSSWLNTSAIQKVWLVEGDHDIKTQARCATHTSIVSEYSSTLKVSPVNQPPDVSSLTPNTGSSQSQTFTEIVHDFVGGNNIDYVQFVVSATETVTAVDSCHVMYAADTNSLYLDRDEGDFEWEDYSVVGSGGHTLENSQCSIAAASASVTINGQYLTVRIPVTFKTAFAGSRYLYTSAHNDRGDDDWDYWGTWSVPSQ